jgi:hypothetical protein
MKKKIKIQPPISKSQRRFRHAIDVPERRVTLNDLKTVVWIVNVSPYGNWLDAAMDPKDEVKIFGGPNRKRLKMYEYFKKGFEWSLLDVFCADRSSN